MCITIKSLQSKVIFKTICSDEHQTWKKLKIQVDNVNRYLIVEPKCKSQKLKKVR